MKRVTHAFLVNRRRSFERQVAEGFRYLNYRVVAASKVKETAD